MAGALAAGEIGSGLLVALTGALAAGEIGTVLAPRLLARPAREVRAVFAVRLHDIPPIRMTKVTVSRASEPRHPLPVRTVQRV